MQYGSGPTVFKTASNHSGNGGDLHKIHDCEKLKVTDPDRILEKPLNSFHEDHPKCSVCW